MCRIVSVAVITFRLLYYASKLDSSLVVFSCSFREIKAVASLLDTFIESQKQHFDAILSLF